MYETVSYGRVVITTSPPRSRMSVERQGELFKAVLDLLLEIGYEQLTLDAVAARAHTSKATLYRQWNGKVGLVIAALRQSRLEREEYFGHGSLDEVFEAMAADADNEPPLNMRLSLTLMHAASVDSEFGATLREVIIEPSVQELASQFEQAAERGEIEHDPALFRRLTYAIIEHMILLRVLDGEPDTVEARRAFFTSVIRPALTFIDTTAG
jgi:AcrR family transcriptional regulator